MDENLSGIYFTKNLDLVYQGKNEKKFNIPDKWIELDGQDEHNNLTLHQRLAMSEAFVASNANAISELNPKLLDANSSRNFLVANIGFLVSNKSYSCKSDKDFAREFISIPVDDGNYSIYRGSSVYHGCSIDDYGKNIYHWENPHSEVNLFRYLDNINVQCKIVISLNEKLQFLFNNYKGHKVYAITIDIHSSREMCVDCEKYAYSVQKGFGFPQATDSSFIVKLEEALKSFGYILPKEKTSTEQSPKKLRLKCATRVSASLPYRSFTDETEEKRRTALMDTQKNRDIKKFSNAVILHAKKEDHADYQFYNKDSYQKLAKTGQTFFSLSRQTVFSNTNNQTAYKLKEVLKISLKS